MKRIQEPQWIDNGTQAYTVFLCTACHNTVKPGERYLIDLFNRVDRNAPRLCGACGVTAVAQTKARRERINRLVLDKVASCPNCRTPYPLTHRIAPRPVHNVTLACRAMRSVEAIAVDGGIDYVCGCKERPKEYAPISHCKAHRYTTINESYAGCCYVCEHPLTSEARAYNRNASQGDKNNFVIVENA